MDIDSILEENKLLKVLVEELQEKLKKYTNPPAHQLFYEKNKEKISSCWGTTPKIGILKIKNNKNYEWEERLNLLKTQIEYWTNEENKTEKTIEVIHLFYDGFK